MVSEGDLNAEISGDIAYQRVLISAGQTVFSREARTSPTRPEPPCFIAFADTVMTSRTPE